MGVATWMQYMLHLWNKLKSQLNWAGLLLWYYSYINMHVDIQLLLWQTVKSPWSKHSTWRHFLHFFCILKTIQTKKKKRNVSVDITLNTEWTLICITWHKPKQKCTNMFIAVVTKTLVKVQSCIIILHVILAGRLASKTFKYM